MKNECSSNVETTRDMQIGSNGFYHRYRNADKMWIRLGQNGLTL
ncbi:MAG TPA: hypothetical protein VE971_00685 [Candidatus Eisenbacteria bacterium]|nr:hypothetical protein [Candidatus Eisenbacteria bacterium]